MNARSPRSHTARRAARAHSSSSPSPPPSAPKSPTPSLSKRPPRSPTTLSRRFTPSSTSWRSRAPRRSSTRLHPRTRQSPSSSMARGAWQASMPSSCCASLGTRISSPRRPRATTRFCERSARRTCLITGARRWKGMLRVRLV